MSRRISRRTRRLASGDWSSFPAGDRAAFLFARKQSKEPWSITAEDLRKAETETTTNNEETE